MASPQERTDICVFAAGSPIGEHYMDAAYRLGRLIGERGYGLVYGGLEAGLMGALAQGAYDTGAHITGVLPRPVDEQYYSPRNTQELLGINTELVGTENLPDRKRMMLQSADAAIALAGGYGTFDEIVTAMEVGRRGRLTRRIGRLLVVNTEGYYDGLKLQIERMIAERTIDPKRDLIPEFVATPEEALAFVDRELVRPRSGLDFIRGIFNVSEEE